MEAILAGMVEGVIVVDQQGRLQLANEAAQRMLKLDVLALGRSYVETIRHPAITGVLAAGLAGHTPDVAQFTPPRDAARTSSARAAPAIGDASHGVVVVVHANTEPNSSYQSRRDF